MFAPGSRVMFMLSPDEEAIGTILQELPAGTVLVTLDDEAQRAKYGDVFAPTAHLTLVEG